MPLQKTAAGIAVVFGVLTVLSGGMALFGGRDMGAVMPFVLWFNFLAGFVYVLAGVGLWTGRRWAAFLAVGLATATSLIAIAFAVQVLRGEAHEARTIGALALRLAVWVWIALVSRPLLFSRR